MASVDNDTYIDLANDDLNRVLVSVSTGLSLIGVSVIILTYTFIKDIRTVSRHVIVCISIADFVTCMSNFWGLLIEPQTKHLYSPLSCKLQSFFGTTSILCSFLWTMMLAVYLYIVLVKDKPALGKRIITPFSHVICWFIPLVINITALAMHRLGNGGDKTSSGWCWISTYKRSHKEVVLWMVIDGKGIEIMTYIVIAVLYILIKLHLKTKIRDYHRSKSPYGTFLTKQTVDAARQTEKKLIFIPLVLFVLRIWGTIRFFYYVFSDHTKVEHVDSTFEKFLLRMHAVGDNLIGFMNCLLFCFFTPKVMYHVKMCCFRCCQKICRRKWNSYDSYYYYDDDDDNGSTSLSNESFYSGDN